ncbi:multicopper oxidase family protein [Kribbella sp. NPDC050124]|uniref:multicopper oxidase family protein n=1 Tax=Kribbella sp. NPDC050124 TaxID=3364114 RepID=UPI0037A53142
MTRRRVLQVCGAAGMTMLVPIQLTGSAGAAVRRTRAGLLEPRTIPKYVTPLVVPPVMPPTTVGAVDYYEIAVRQFRQQILPAGLPATTVWSYGSVNHPGTFNYPAFTIEASYRRPVRVRWINGLVDDQGNYLPHLLPVDPTLHWANPPGGTAGRDSRPDFDVTPGPYDGPVPIVTHLHGGHTADHADGYAEAWYLPDAANIPAGFARQGTFYDYFAAKSPIGSSWSPGDAVFEYANDQRAGTLWYHDHTLGMTRTNVYAGPAGFYLLRRGPGDLPTGVLPGPAPRPGDPAGTRYYEIPLAIQDRSFNDDGSLSYPDTREFFDQFPGPYVPETDVPPIWNPEFFATTIVVNGNTWPRLEVEPRRYRFRLLNGCNSRFLILALTSDPLTRPVTAALPFWQLGADGGFLPAPVRRSQLLMAPAERVDAIVDFTGLPPSTELYLVNLGPDEPFGELTDPPEPFADPETTGQVMKLVVVPPASRDTSLPPDRLRLPAFKALGAASTTRAVSLTEEASTVPGFDGPIAAKLGTMDDNGVPVALGWDDAMTENPATDAIEIWELHNFTEDAHPIHIHEVQFQVVDRRPFGGTARGPDAGEAGFKDTVIAYPGEVTRVRALFDLPGLFVWHCHIVEHEDNEMMRPYHVGPIPNDLP